MFELHPTFIVDANGQPTSAILSLEEVERAFNVIESSLGPEQASVLRQKLGLDDRMATKSQALTLEQSVKQIISRLCDHRSCPKYQFERASEVFLAPFIEEWLGEDLELVTMEFPLKKDGNNQSKNADYLFQSPNGWVFVEVKTELGKLPSEQIQAYVKAMALENGTVQLLSDLKEIASISRQKTKYAELLRKTEHFDGCDKLSVRVIYVTPHDEKPTELKESGIEWKPLRELFCDFSSKRHPDLWKQVVEMKKAFSF